MFYVYVLKHSLSGKIYIGQTADLELRIKRHNGILKSKGRSYTKLNRGDGIWEIVYKESYHTRGEAMIREKELKSHKGRDWLKVNLGV